MKYYGELAALLTAIAWTFNSVTFTIIGRRVGSLAVNHIRMWMALPLLCLLHLFMFGTFLPNNLDFHRILFLGLSGIIGLAIGDAFLFEAFLIIGPRLTLLIMLLAPLFSAILAWLFLGEGLLILEIIGMAITMTGIGWVIMGREQPSSGSESKINSRPPRYLTGVILAVGGAIGQAVGLLFSRIGLEGGVSPISGNTIRIAAATLAMTIVSLFNKTFIRYIGKIKDRKIFWGMLAGVISGPIIGIILSLEAITHTQIGVASTLMSISPVLLIPVSHFLFKEKITLKAIIGTAISLLGIILLFV